MDNGFAPGPEKDDLFTYAGRLRRLFQRRAQARLVQGKAVGTVAEFVNGRRALMRGHGADSAAPMLDGAARGDGGGDSGDPPAR
jgi:hypothetical protein